MLLPRDGGWLRYNYGKVKWGCWWWMKSNEDVDWGVIFSVASACVQHRHFWTEAGEWYVYEPDSVTSTHISRIHSGMHKHKQKKMRDLGKMFEQWATDFLTRSSAQVWEDWSWETIHVVVSTPLDITWQHAPLFCAHTCSCTLLVSFTRYFSTVLSHKTHQ